MNTDLLIVGGGPAGLNAACKAASEGIRTTIVDKWFSLGGKLQQQTQIHPSLPKDFSAQRGFQLANSFIEKLQQLNVTMLEAHTMVGAYQNGEIGVTNNGAMFPVHADKIILAPGAMEEPMIFPGWTLPGVMTAGAAQVMMNRERVLPGKKALIAGSNDSALETALQLHECGTEVMGVIERESHIQSKNNESVKNLEDACIPLLLHSCIESATGKGEVEQVNVKTENDEILYDIDLICIANGMTPILEPFEIMGCGLTYHEKLGGWCPKYDSHFETMTPSIYAAGNATGIQSIGGALLTGEIAAVSVLESLNITSAKQAREEKKQLWHELYRIEPPENHSILDAMVQVTSDFHYENGSRPLINPDSKGGLING